MLGFGSAGRFFHSKGIGARIGFDQVVAVSLGTASFKFSNLVFKLVYASQQRTLALGGLNSILLHGDYVKLHSRYGVLQACQDRACET